MLFDALKLLLQLFTVLNQRCAAFFARDEMPLESAIAFAATVAFAVAVAATSTTTTTAALSTMLLSALVMVLLVMVAFMMA